MESTKLTRYNNTTIPQTSLGQSGFFSPTWPYINIRELATFYKVNTLIQDININIADNLDQEVQTKMNAWKHAVRDNPEYVSKIINAIIQATNNGAAILGYDIFYEDENGNLTLDKTEKLKSIELFTCIPNFYNDGTTLNQNELEPVVATFYRKVNGNKSRSSCYVIEARSKKERKYIWTSKIIDSFVTGNFTFSTDVFKNTGMNLLYDLDTKNATQNKDGTWTRGVKRDNVVNDVIIFTNKRMEVYNENYAQLSDFWGLESLEYPIFAGIERYLYEMNANISQRIGRIDPFENNGQTLFETDNKILALGRIANALGQNVGNNTNDLLSQRNVIISNDSQAKIETINSTFSSDVEVKNITNMINLYIKLSTGVDLGLTYDGTQMVTGQVASLNNASANYVAATVKWYESQIRSLLKSSLVNIYGQEFANSVDELWTINLTGNLTNKANQDNSQIISLYQAGLIDQRTALSMIGFSNFEIDKIVEETKKQSTEQMLNVFAGENNDVITD